MVTEPIDYLLNRAEHSELVQHLRICDKFFVPPLSQRVDLSHYVQKLVSTSQRFEARSGGELIGLIAVYCNDFVGRKSFITNVSVLPKWQGRGIGACLLDRCIDYVHNLEFKRIELIVDNSNTAAITLYAKQGFKIGTINSQSRVMYIELEMRRNDERQKL